MEERAERPDEEPRAEAVAPEESGPGTGFPAGSVEEATRGLETALEDVLR